MPVNLLEQLDLSSRRRRIRRIVAPRKRKTMSAKTAMDLFQLHVLGELPHHYKNGAIDWVSMWNEALSTPAYLRLKQHIDNCKERDPRMSKGSNGALLVDIYNKLSYDDYVVSFDAVTPWDEP
jgi:hypothetical protein